MFKLDTKPHLINELDDILTEALKEGIDKNNQGISYYRIVFAFDIETTSFTDQVTKNDHNEKRSIMYIWQLAINGRCIIGRTWNDFLYVMNHIVERLELSKYKRILCFIHNLSFEFTYICKLFDWLKVFSISKRKPIYALTTNGIEFRCSYLLTNYSLAKLGDQLHKYKVSKMVGDLDYSLIRTPLTPLTDEELQYCINDVLVVSAYIKEQIEAEKYIYRIPMTCTGYCRRYVRKKCLYGERYSTWRKQYRKYKSLMNSLTLTLDEYCQLKRAFQGGFTHSASEYSTFTVENVDHVDFTSSYPYCLLSEEYPMSSSEVIDVSKISKEELEDYLRRYCCLFDVTFTNLRPKFKYESYIPAYKCFNKSLCIVNNGRVHSGTVSLTITNVDMEIINFAYEFDYMEIANFRIYQKQYLPVELCRSLIELYKKKTELKGVKDKEQEYLVAKGLLNSCY